MALHTNKKTIAAAGASLALAATIVGTGLIAPSTAVWAAPSAPSIEHMLQNQPGPNPGQPGQPGPGWRGPDMQQRQQMHQAFQSALAGRLGISVDQLTAAMKQARIDTVNQAVAAGKLTQDQANRMIQAIQSGQQPGMRWGGPQSGQPGQQGPGAGWGMMRPGGPGGEVATILGMTPQDLQAQFQAGKSLAEIAQARGISRDDLKKKLLDAENARLGQAVQAGRLTQQQADEIKTRRAANIDHILDMKPGQRGPQRPAGGGA